MRKKNAIFFNGDSACRLGSVAGLVRRDILGDRPGSRRGWRKGELLLNLRSLLKGIFSCYSC